jgi:hypothetical protein
MKEKGAANCEMKLTNIEPVSLRMPAPADAKLTPRRMLGPVAAGSSTGSGYAIPIVSPTTNHKRKTHFMREKITSNLQTVIS